MFTLWHMPLGVWVHLLGFFTIFTKGTNICDFLFASLPFQKRLLLKERKYFLKSNIFPLRVGLRRKGNEPTMEFLPLIKN